MIKQITKIREFLILSILFLFPVTFASSFVDQLNLPKLIILLFLIAIILVVIAVEVYLTGKIYLAKSKFDLPILIIVLSYLVSAIFVTPNKMEAFFLPGTASFVLGFGILYFLLNTIIDKNKIKLTLIGSAVALSFITFASFLGILEKIPQLPAYIRTPGFNPTGDYLTASIFLASTIGFTAIFMIRESDIVKKVVYSFSLVLILVALGVSVFTLVSNGKKATPVLPSYGVSWKVAVDTIGESPLLGIGPGNYLTAFNRFRPVTYNLTNLWQLRFSTGRDLYLTVLTEAGLLGALGMALLIITIFKFIDRNMSIYKESRSVLVDVVSITVLLLLLIIFAIFPVTPTTLLLLFVMVALNSQAKIVTLSFENHKSQTSRIALAAILIGLVLLFGFKARPVLLAEQKFKQANDALVANDGKKTYELLQQTINLNPLVDRYHASYAQVNLAIARSIASSQTDPKNLTDDQKNTILQLIQQSIKEGQNTVALNNTRAANWQVLASIYQIIIPYANQADQFAIDSYNQTINLDPVDPNLRINLAGLYYSLGQYDNAISTLQFAVIAKSDLPNAYYNLAAAYAGKNDFTNAIAAMNKVLALVTKDSNDYKTAQQALTDLQNKQKTVEPTNGTGSLTAPTKQQQALNPQLNLPSEASPPAAPKIATPTPTTQETTEGGLPITPTPTATLSPSPTAKP